MPDTIDPALEFEFDPQQLKERAIAIAAEIQQWHAKLGELQQQKIDTDAEINRQRNEAEAAYNKQDRAINVELTKLRANLGRVEFLLRMAHTRKLDEAEMEAVITERVRAEVERKTKG